MDWSGDYIKARRQDDEREINENARLKFSNFSILRFILYFSKEKKEKILICICKSLRQYVAYTIIEAE